jgi:putative methionine-R-sulfoxide reductase with GAF domain
MAEQIFQLPVPDRDLSVVDKLRLLLDITKKISRSLDLDEVLKLVMDTLSSLIPYDAAGIYLVDCAKGTSDEPCSFRSAALNGYELGELADPKLRVGEGFIGYVAQTGKTILSHDVSKDPRYFEARNRTRSEMVAPIVSNNEVIGVFDLESDELNAYDEDDFTNRWSRKNACRRSSKWRGRFSSSFCLKAIRICRVSISAATTFPPRKFPETITIGCRYSATRSG